MSRRKKSVLRICRIVLSILSFVLISALFINTSSNTSFAFLASAQFIPALLGANFVLLGVYLIVTLLFGRLYCSVICPLGLTQDFANYLTKKIGGKKAESRFGYKKPHTVLRYVVLVVFVVLMVVGAGFFVSLLDPYAEFGRIVTDIFQPVVIGINNLLSRLMPDSFGREQYVGVNSIALSVAIVTFVVVVWMAVKKGRLYCNSICPVGSLLGLISRFSIFRPKIDLDKCINCGMCAKKCKASCIDPQAHKIDTSRCVDCFDCLDNCSTGAISISTALKSSTDMKSENDVNDKDASRRSFLSSVALIGLTGPKMMAQDLSDRVDPSAKSSRRKTAVSPFGSESHEHLTKNCTACHLCISNCPTKVLRPAVSEYGLDGVMAPIMDYSKGYCEYECTVCSQVCPSDAIQTLTADEKQSIQVGLAVFDKDLCVVSRDNVSCGHCSTHCPAGAIKLVPDYTDPERRVYPKIEAALCIGCGACEYHCPSSPAKAIHVEGFLIHK